MDVHGFRGVLISIETEVERMVCLLSNREKRTNGRVLKKIRKIKAKLTSLKTSLLKNETKNEKRYLNV